MTFDLSDMTWLQRETQERERLILHLIKLNSQEMMP